MIRLRTRLLRVAPPGWVVAGFLLCYLICEGPVWYLQWKFGRVDMPNRFGPKILRAGAFLLGVYRTLAFHPYFRPGYLHWLKGTPWTVSRPLPLGPVELVPEDCLALGMLALLGTTLPDFTSLYVINLFLFGHIFATILTFWKTGSMAYGYIAILFLGFIPQFWGRQWVDFALLAAIYLLVHEGLWHVLRKFPWQTEGFLRDINVMTTPGQTVANPSCGWSFDRLHRDMRTAKGINRTDALLCSMLGSWWLFSLSSLIADPRERRICLAMVVMPAIAASAGARYLVYAHGCQRPISFWGRIWTFQWIIPGYDQIFVGPICSILGGFLVLWLMRDRFGADEVRYPIAGGVAVLLALISPPTLRRFRLTGRHRLAQTLSERQAASAAVSRS
jgi:hypothetical protein